jgi:ankyrin repeat protein
VNAKERSRNQTALMWAVAEEHPDVVQVLLEFHADVRARSNVRRRPVNTGPAAQTGAHLYDALGVVDQDQGGFTALLFAARQGAIACGKLLVAAGANVNDTAPDGVSALVLAAHSGHEGFSTFLLQHGADPNAADAGYTALHAAVLRGDLKLVKALLGHGANPNALLAKGTPRTRSPLDWTLEHAWIGASPFWLAAQFVDPDALRILAASGADRAVKLKDGTTALMAAISGNRGARAAVVGADVDEVRDIDERNALRTVELLVELGADVNAVDAAGNTALHRAVAKRYDLVIQSLVDKGAKVDARNNKGQTPLATLRGSEPDQKFEVADPKVKTTAALLRKLGATE